ncbi:MULTISPECIES: error-prone DNA polymerase [unclassified Sphingomonas]|uniref:error-prone DNA polymerase n=1 Tax=unclassified Sphingomonas TaxID=196159 RepID=UPI000925A061|nr:MULTISPECIES: error-prone DNA polymerase [unclassified Sphingomonas]OJU23458.1 MAG: error-prone DNA polymerase [Sphingomonas sp. 66-10]
MTYSELQVTTHYSFLRGASSCEQLVATAALLGMPALGIVDRNSVAGTVRALRASEHVREDTGIDVRAIPGCRLDLVSGDSLLVWPEDRAAWSRLTSLLGIGKARADAQRGEKGKCFLHWEDLAARADGLVAALVADHVPDARALRWMADLFGANGRGHVCLTHHRRPGDALRLHETALAAEAHGLTPLATGDVLYHHPSRRMLQDVVTAIREKTTIDALGFRRERHADRHLLPPDEMARRFRDHPRALGAVEAVVERCRFSLRDLTYQYPDEIVIPGKSAQEALATLAWNGLRQKFGPNPSDAHRKLLEHELRLVEKMGYAPYFLTVNSIVQYARSQEIVCQGRGSAANSVICFALGITSIDPIEHKLLFERFISEERHEPPDIDVDFEHERREEVIQWIYEHYGHEHAALTAVVSRFRSRGAIREVGKALGLPEDMTAALSGQVWGWSNDGVPEHHVTALGLDPREPRLALALELASELIGTPRHLSQHPGGFVLTRTPLRELVPIEPAAMVDRYVIEWEKDDIEFLGFMKVDILGLGMLGCMRRAYDLLGKHKGIRLNLASPLMQQNDPATFEMIGRADTLGVFQIESRAQMSMLPRMKPVNFYDIAIQVAIVRPGPIQGGMVHPYLKRRIGVDKVTYPNDALKAVLEKTLGVPLFQEQAMQVAIVGAGFSPGEADRLRRAMATFKSNGGVDKFRAPLIDGMLERGITREFAERLVKQIEGFGSYGFPESHAASFAKIAYASSWMKCHHPDVFCAALLNAQPMGFYAPAQIVRDARAHGVEVRPVCVMRSEWDTILEDGGGAEPPTPFALSLSEGCPSSEEESAGLRQARPERGIRRNIFPLRLGLRIVAGLSAEQAGKIVTARAARAFTSVEDVWRRAGVPLAALERLAKADAFAGLGVDRRQALWAIRGLGEKPLPLLAGLETHETPVHLKALAAGREVVEDYRATQLSLRPHPLSFLRGELTRRRIVPCADLATIPDGRMVEVAGLILVRQRPGSAKGVLFLTIEDESGIANGILWPDRFEAHRRIVMSSAMVSIRGRVQKEGIVIHVVTEQVTDLTWLLRQVGDIDLPKLAPRGATPSGPDHGFDRDAEEWRPRPRSDYHFNDGGGVIPIRSHDFH